MGVAWWWKLIRHRSNKKSNKNNKTDTSSQVCGDYILIFREWKRSIDRLTDKNTARWIDG